tara:strand:+ start:356 stop:1618 length:1263 start_codon:yes stop_codon:yes gene_type:complete
MGVNSCGTTLIDQAVFKNIGAIIWDTTVKTSGFTAVSGNGYFCNTTSAAFTVTLPSSPSAGDVVAIADYANTFDTNNVTIARNGSNIQGSAADFKASIEGLSITLIYVDGTQGWLSIDAAQANDIIIPPAFITATGGTITTSGDYKIHTFTSPGTFCVSSLSNPLGGPNNVDYLVVAGGGGGSGKGQEDVGGGGGGGAGGHRSGFPSPTGTTPVSVTAYPIAVGAGGAGGPNTPGPSGSPTREGSNGSNSSGVGITSTAGGGGGNSGGGPPGGFPGGSGGGGGGSFVPGGTGNTPPVSPPQGNPGGNEVSNKGAAGGGASAAGQNGQPGSGGAGGAGSANSINGSSITRAGGGGGGGYSGAPGGAGGAGGGGAGSVDANATSGTANTGGGGGGVGGPNTGTARSGGTGGSGIVIIRYKFQ